MSSIAMKSLLKKIGLEKKPSTSVQGKTLVEILNPAPALSAPMVEDKVIHSTSAVVYEEYASFSSIPPLEDQWTRFVCISDTHSRTFAVPDGDVLLHSGDLTNTGRMSEFKATMEWLYGLPHKVKIVVAGNHDLTLHQGWYEDHWARWHRQPEDNYDSILDLLQGEKAKKAGIVYLENESYTFSLGQGRREWTVYGSPWSPWFHNWAFNYRLPPDSASTHNDDGDYDDDHPNSDDAPTASEIISIFPTSDILLTHGPPKGIFDFTLNGKFVGCPVLLDRLVDGRLRPKLHAFGHIHESHGAYIHTWPGTPVAQNAYFERGTREYEEDEGGPIKDMRDAVKVAVGLAEETSALRDAERTVFVNAANYPMGVGSRGRPFGGPGFRPVVVDLKD